MTNGPKDAWGEVGERFTALGRRLANSYRAKDSSDASAAETQRKVEDVVREIGNQLGRALDALDETVRDEEARRDLKGAFNALGTAISTTVDEATEAIRGGSSTKPREDDAG